MSTEKPVDKIVQDFSHLYPLGTLPDDILSDEATNAVSKQLEAKAFLKKILQAERTKRDEMVEQAITNTGEELLRLVETKHTREMQSGENRAKYLAFQRGEEHMRQKIIDTLKKHITSVTGVE